LPGRLFWRRTPTGKSARIFHVIPAQRITQSFPRDDKHSLVKEPRSSPGPSNAISASRSPARSLASRALAREGAQSKISSLRGPGAQNLRQAMIANRAQPQADGGISSSPRFVVFARKISTERRICGGALKKRFSASRRATA